MLTLYFKGAYSWFFKFIYLKFAKQFLEGLFCFSVISIYCHCYDIASLPASLILVSWFLKTLLLLCPWLADGDSLATAGQQQQQQFLFWPLPDVKDTLGTATNQRPVLRLTDQSEAEDWSRDSSQPIRTKFGGSLTDQRVRRGLSSPMLVWGKVMGSQLICGDNYWAHFLWPQQNWMVQGTVS